MPTPVADKRPRPTELGESNPLWYKDAVIYQTHVKTFRDGNGDGVGDFEGLSSRLGYLESLGISAVWLLPFYPSPLRDDGYDIADYTSINPAYGSMRDFRRFLHEAHERGIRVITELVLNHTSDQHPWFQRARRAPKGSPERDYYVWSDTPERYRDARIIFKDFENSNWAWDPVAKAYYWHRFYSHQPDLNFENPRVRREIRRVIDFWFDMGVDGMRLDAVPYLYEQEGTSCENLPPTYAFLRELRAHVDARFADRMLLAEANQWPEDAAGYFGDGDCCHMAFHFPLMPRIFMALQMEDWFPIVDIMEQTPRIPDTAQWAIFLRNHDELTLEMMSDEERDYMYRRYAHDHSARINLGIRRRLAPLLKNSRRRLELINALLLSLPGTPILYYGDEIGMGDNHYLGDRNGVRTPMQWSADRNAGFSEANPQKLLLPVIIDPEYHYEAVNVATQEGNLSSLLWWTRRVIAMRRKYRAFARGETTFVKCDNAHVLAFTRTWESETMLVVVNLSRFSQMATLDLSAWSGAVPLEVFSGNSFAPIRDTPYAFTLGFHDYFWFLLRRTPEGGGPKAGERPLPELHAAGPWQELFEGQAGDDVEQRVLVDYLRRRTDAGCRSLGLREAAIVDMIPADDLGLHAILLLVRVQYATDTDEADVVMLPVAFDSEPAVRALLQDDPDRILARVTGAVTGLLYDCGAQDVFVRALAGLIATRRRVQGLMGLLEGGAARRLQTEGVQRYEGTARAYDVERHCTSFVLAERWSLKVFRALDEGDNTESEVLRFLARSSAFAGHVPEYLGSLRYRDPLGGTREVALLTRYVKSRGTAWETTLDQVVKYYEELLARREEMGETAPPVVPLLEWGSDEGLESLPVKPPLASAQAIGVCTAAMHRALAAESGGAAFAPEPFTSLYMRSLYQAMRSRATMVLRAARRRLGTLDGARQAPAQELLRMEKELVAAYGALLHRRISCVKIRIQGNYHLAQLLTVGNDYVIRDFEGDPTRSLGERRLKRSALRDVAGMVESLRAVAFTALRKHMRVTPKDVERLEPWAEFWFAASVRRMLAAYVEALAGTPVLPANPADTRMLLRLYLVEREVDRVGDLLEAGDDGIADPVAALGRYLHS